MLQQKYMELTKHYINDILKNQILKECQLELQRQIDLLTAAGLLGSEHYSPGVIGPKSKNPKDIMNKAFYYEASLKVSPGKNEMFMISGHSRILNVNNWEHLGDDGHVKDERIYLSIAPIEVFTPGQRPLRTLIVSSDGVIVFDDPQPIDIIKINLLP